MFEDTHWFRYVVRSGADLAWNPYSFEKINNGIPKSVNYRKKKKRSGRK